VHTLNVAALFQLFWGDPSIDSGLPDASWPSLTIGAKPSVRVTLRTNLVNAYVAGSAPVIATLSSIECYTGVLH
jgi:hypothetical protein